MVGVGPPGKIPIRLPTHSQSAGDEVTTRSAAMKSLRSHWSCLEGARGLSRTGQSAVRSRAGMAKVDTRCQATLHPSRRAKMGAPRPTRNAELEVRLLGPLEVLKQEQPIPLGGPKPRALLA